MILFLDTSAFIKLFIQEHGSGELIGFVRRLARDETAVASIAQIEAHSVLRRRMRNREMPEGEFRSAADGASGACAAWLEIPLTDGVVQRALDVLTRHPLRSLDAIQLASALELSDELQPAETIVFIASDHRLLACAVAEGLETWDPESGPPPVNFMR